MTENQLTKLKNRLINVQAQLSGASVILAKGEPFINSKVSEANKLVAEALKMCENIKTHEPQEKPKKHRSKEVYISGTHEVIIARNEPPTYNKLCRHYYEVRTRDNKVLERTCIVGMDMRYCSKKCAYATNNVCSLRG